MGGDDEDYWNASDSKAFSFDDGEFSLKSNLFDTQKTSRGSHDHTTKTSSITDTIFAGVPMLNQEPVDRPLGSLISKFSLTRILETDIPKPKGPATADEELRLLRRQVDEQWIAPPAAKTIKSIMLGQKYSLHLYQSLEQKTQLLHEATKCGDGNAVLAVLLHLSKTLKKSLFYQLLQTRPMAVSHYVQYLSTRLQTHDVTDLLEMLGQNHEAALKQFQFSVQSVGNIERKLQRLKQCYSNHFCSPDSKDKQFIINYITYLEWLRAVETSVRVISSNSVLSSLAEVCRTNWTDSKGSLTSPQTLHSHLHISERQFQWTVLSARSSHHAWDDVHNLFITKGWLGGKKLKSVISMDKLVLELHRNSAPPQVLAQYLDLFDSLDKKLDMAKRLACHAVVIDSYVALKDRQGLVEYKAVLIPHSEDYLHAEKSLMSPVKWKN